jgi:hypothetical protein
MSENINVTVPDGTCRTARTLRPIPDPPPRRCGWLATAEVGLYFVGAASVLGEVGLRQRTQPVLLDIPPERRVIGHHGREGERGRAHQVAVMRMPLPHAASSQDVLGARITTDGFAIATWFQRTIRLARAVTDRSITFDEARDDLVTQVACAEDLVALRKAASDAETLLGNDSLLVQLLDDAAERVTQPTMHIGATRPS